MKKQTAVKMVLTIFAVAFIAAAVLKVNRIIGYAGSILTGAGKYNVGDGKVTEPVRNLDIEWTSGTVSIEYHDEDTVVLTEKSDGALSSDRKMRWRLDGDTLRVRYAKEGLNLFSLFSPGFEKRKELTVTLPEGTVLKDADIEATSGTLNIPYIQAAEVGLNVTSGEILVSADAKEVNCGATSGSIRIEDTGDAEEIKASATSGSISIKAGNAEKILAEITSGEIYVEAQNIESIRTSTTSGTTAVDAGNTGKVRASSTSGDIRLTLGGVESLNVDATSGDVTVSLPAKPGFTAKLGAASGKIKCGSAVEKDGKTYVCGDGSGKVSIDTTSGSISLEAVEE